MGFPHGFDSGGDVCPPSQRGRPCAGEEHRRRCRQQLQGERRRHEQQGDRRCRTRAEPGSVGGTQCSGKPGRGRGRRFGVVVGSPPGGRGEVPARASFELGGSSPSLALVVVIVVESRGKGAAKRFGQRRRRAPVIIIITIVIAGGPGLSSP